MKRSPVDSRIPTRSLAISTPTTPPRSPPTIVLPPRSASGDGKRARTNSGNWKRKRSLLKSAAPRIAPTAIQKLSRLRAKGRASRAERAPEEREPDRVREELEENVNEGKTQLQPLVAPQFRHL